MFSDAYDKPIEEAWAYWHPGEDWRWGKAQFFQESRLDPNAVSPVGAAGIAQFMPATWGDVPWAVRLGVLDRHQAEPSIRAGAWYMNRQKKVWYLRRSPSDQRRLAQASYNAGGKRILDAQIACDDARHWPKIKTCLRHITGKRNSHETRTYVHRIERWYWEMQ